MPILLIESARDQHESLVEMEPLYKETAHWHAVATNKNYDFQHSDQVGHWLEWYGLERGTPQARNDYLVPFRHLFLFKNRMWAKRFALEFGI